jgi:rod shape determining protein RodA
MIAIRGVRWKQIDPLILLATAALTVLGIALVGSATRRYYDPPTLVGNSWFLKELFFVLLGFGCMAVCACISPRVYRMLAYPVYGLSVLLLAAVLVLGHGHSEFGANRWIVFAGFPIQPSEPMKIALVLIVARVLGREEVRLRDLALSVALLAAPFLLIYVQPDLGTAVSLLAIWFGMLVLSNAPARYVGAVSVVGLIAMPLSWFVMKDFQRERVLIFLNPRADALGQGYNILQAQMSIASGGMWGKGLFEGTQTQLGFLRVSHSDFIFSVLGEELGFVGAIVLFALFVVLLLRMLRARDVANEQFSGLLCAGVMAMITFQTVANLSANIGLTPVVGIPLPFVSYGGSALITQLAAIGIVQATLVRRRLYRFEA